MGSTWWTTNQSQTARKAAPCCSTVRPTRVRPDVGGDVERRDRPRRQAPCAAASEELPRRRRGPARPFAIAATKNSQDPLDHHGSGVRSRCKWPAPDSRRRWSPDTPRASFTPGRTAPSRRCRQRGAGAVERSQTRALRPPGGTDIPEHRCHLRQRHAPGRRPAARRPPRRRADSSRARSTGRPCSSRPAAAPLRDVGWDDIPALLADVSRKNGPGRCAAPRPHRWRARRRVRGLHAKSLLLDTPLPAMAAGDVTRRIRLRRAWPRRSRA